MSVSRSLFYKCLILISLLHLLILGVMYWSLDTGITVMEERLTLLRILSYGRVRSDIIFWMGEPSRIDTNITFQGQEGYAVMIYRSDPYSRQKWEDIWIVLDKQDRVVAVYYPETPQEREILKRNLFWRWRQ